MRTFIIPTLIGFVLGALGGFAAIQGRGSVDLGASSFEGLSAIAIVAALLGAIGLIVGLIIWILMRALKIAQNIDQGS